MAQAKEKLRIGLILAGGAGARMGGADKGSLMLAGARLIDRVAERLYSQVDRMLISGRHDYGLGLPFVTDRDDGPAGPAAGLWAALCWFKENSVPAEGVLTAPADGPFVPCDLAAKLCSPNVSAVSSNGVDVHPTFAWHRVGDLEAVFKRVNPEDAPSLRSICEDEKAKRVAFSDAHAFFNINTPKDLARAEALLEAK